MPAEPSPPAAGPSYGVAIRRHRRVVLGVAAVGLVAGLLWLALRSPAYEATADILVAPVSPNDEALIGVQVIRDAPGDPTRTMQTAASVLESPASAAAAASVLRGAWTQGKVEDAVRVEPSGETSIVAVTARASSARDAAQVANAYAAGALRVRNRIVGAQIARRSFALDQRLRLLRPRGQAAADLADRRDELSTLQGDDPSLSLASLALAPSSTSGTPGWVILALMLANGLAVGVATAVALEWAERGRRPVRARASRRASAVSAPDGEVAGPVRRAAARDR
jgi:uncharacterized protein involved in exopolysaccharide biosynthesis